MPQGSGTTMPSEHAQLIAKLDQVVVVLERVAALLEPQAATRRVSTADVLSLQQTARALKRRYTAVRELVQTGRIPGRQDENGHWFIPRESVERYIAENLDGAA